MQLDSPSRPSAASDLQELLADAIGVTVPKDYTKSLAGEIVSKAAQDSEPGSKRLPLMIPVLKSEYLFERDEPLSLTKKKAQARHLSSA